MTQTLSTRTVCCKLSLDMAAAATIRQTAVAFNAAATYCAQVAWAERITNKNKLHRIVYGPSRINVLSNINGALARNTNEQHLLVGQAAVQNLGQQNALATIVTLTQQADVIIIGQVVTLASRFSKNQYNDEIIVSDVALKVEETLKGQVSGQDIVWRDLHSGSVGDISMSSSDTPFFTQNMRAVLFLENKSNSLEVIGGETGKFVIDETDHIPEVGRSLAHVRIEILSYLTGSRIYSNAIGVVT